MIPHHTNKTAPIIGLCWAPSGGDISLVQLEQNTTQPQYDGPVWTVGWKVLTDQGNQYQVSLTTATMHKSNVHTYKLCKLSEASYNKNNKQQTKITKEIFGN